MNVKLVVAVVSGMLGLLAVTASPQSGNELFSQAVRKEALGEMSAAIVLYQTIVEKYPTDRALVAKALLQIGLCNNKLGNETEARRAFERIVRDYKDQTVTTAEARDHLTELDRDRPVIQFGAIRGRVTERGQPYHGKVFALKRVYYDGQRLVTTRAFTETNDRGEYELSSLRPGKYYVAVPVPATSADGRVDMTLHVPIFFPNTPDQQQAKVVDVKAGATIPNLNIDAVPVPMRRVRGRVTGRVYYAPPSIDPGTIEITAAPTNGELPNALMNLPLRASAHPNHDDTFEFPAVPPGTYVLSAPQALRMAGRVAVEVRDHDVENVTIAMVPGLTLSGRIVLEPQANFASYPGGISARSYFQVVLRMDPALRGSNYFVASMDPRDGSFIFQTMLVINGRRGQSAIPLWLGDYRVSVEPILAPPPAPEGLVPVTPPSLEKLPQQLEGAYVKSMRLGNADVLNDGLHLQEQPRQDLIITIGTNPAAIEGRVVNGQGGPVPESTVVLIPEGGIRFRIEHKSIVTDAGGRFQLQHIPPGDYKLFAWKDVEKGAWQDPDFVREYESRGIGIHLAEGEKRANIQVVGIPNRP